jgi:hypothetical protein
MLARAAKIGEKLGLRVYADLPEWRTELEFDLPPDNLDRVKEIDVLWYKDNENAHEFEGRKHYRYNRINCKRIKYIKSRDPKIYCHPRRTRVFLQTKKL